MKENLKKNEAITLISLVVTIIVLIILAGVSINLILGQDGIITKAREAKQNMEFAAEEEARSLNELYSQMSVEGVGSNSNEESSKLIEFKKQIASAITEMGVTTSEDADVDTMASNIRNIISSDGCELLISNVVGNNYGGSNETTYTITVPKDIKKGYLIAYGYRGVLSPTLSVTTSSGTANSSSKVITSGYISRVICELQDIPKNGIITLTTDVWLHACEYILIG